MELITKTQVPENKRLEFLPHFVGKHFMTYAIPSPKWKGSYYSCNFNL